jgi:hypothetical protein
LTAAFFVDDQESSAGSSLTANENHDVVVAAATSGVGSDHRIATAAVFGHRGSPNGCVSATFDCGSTNVVGR